MHTLFSIILAASFIFSSHCFAETRIEKVDRLENEMIQLKLDIQEAKSSHKTLVRLSIAAGVVSVLIGGVGAAMVSGNQTGPMARIITQNGKLFLMGDLVPVAVTAGGFYLVYLNSKQIERLGQAVDQKTEELHIAKLVLESAESDDVAK